jgi:hypothetical protein
MSLQPTSDLQPVSDLQPTSESSARCRAFGFVWIGAVWLVLELFLLFDWDQGRIRFVLVGVLGALLWVFATRARERSTPRAASTHVAVGVPGGLWAQRALWTGVLLSFAAGMVYLVRDHRSGTVQSDQAQTVIDALHVLRSGGNPYGAGTVTDRVAYGLATDAIAAKPGCRGSDETVQFRVGQTGDGVVPAIAPARECAEISRLFSSLGFKYGPATLLVYWPFVAAFGADGFIILHLVTFALCLALLYRWALGVAGSAGLPGPAATALLLFVWPTHLVINAFQQEHLDLPAVCLVVLAWVYWWPRGGRGRADDRGRFVAAAICLGLSASMKLLPALLYVPILAKAPRRTLLTGFTALTWLAAASVVFLFFAPFAWWDWTGLWHNSAYPFFRDADSTAMAFYLSRRMATALRVAGVLAALTLAARAHLRAWAPREAIEYLLGAHLAVLGTGTTLHNNYLLWLLPLLPLFIIIESTSPLDDREIVAVAPLLPGAVVVSQAGVANEVKREEIDRRAHAHLAVGNHLLRR